MEVDLLEFVRRGKLTSLVGAGETLHDALADEHLHGLSIGHGIVWADHVELWSASWGRHDVWRCVWM